MKVRSPLGFIPHFVCDDCWCDGNCSYPSTMQFIRSSLKGASLVAQAKESACKAEDLGPIPGLGRSPWRREWIPTPVFLPGESHGQRSLAGYSPWDLKTEFCVCIWGPKGPRGRENWVRDGRGCPAILSSLSFPDHAGRVSCHPDFPLVSGPCRLHGLCSRSVDGVLGASPRKTHCLLCFYTGVLSRMPGPFWAHFVS